MNESNTPPRMPAPDHCPHCGTPLPVGALAGLCPACLLKQGATADTATAAGSGPFVPPDLAEIARLFPQLEILGLLGKGGMGAVYKARQPSLDRLVALKILPAQTGSGGNFTERFNREARALARLSHPNIVGVHEFGAAGALNYFIMELVDGVNLRQLQRSGRLSPREALQIVPQVCDALQYAHDEGIVHRDIKPENILVDRKGRVKIADFGLARILGSDPANLRLTGEGHVMGTPHYMAPEQVEHPQSVDHRADIYSLGVVFYEMLTGELPLGRFSPPSSKVQLDVRLDEVVLHALEKEPHRRYQHVAEVKTAVETITQNALGSARNPTAQTSFAGEAGPQHWLQAVQRRLRAPLVGRSGGRRVVNWSRLTLRSVLALFALAVLSQVIGGYFASPALGALVVVNGLAIMMVLLAVRLLRGFAQPLELLPELQPGRSSSRVAVREAPGSQKASAKAAIIGVMVAFLTFCAAFVVTGLTPHYYGAKALVLVRDPGSGLPGMPAFDPYFVATEFELLKSVRVLDEAIKRLNLQDRWSQAEQISLDEARTLFSRRLSLRQIKNSSLIEIWYVSEDPNEAAEIVNTIATICLDARPSGTFSVVERAQPNPRQVRPNIGLNLAVGAVLGLFLGLLASGLTLWLTGRGRGNSPQNDTLVSPSRVPWGRWLTVGLLLIGFLLILLLTVRFGRHPSSPLDLVQHRNRSAINTSEPGQPRTVPETPAAIEPQPASSGPAGDSALTPGPVIHIDSPRGRTANTDQSQQPALALLTRLRQRYAQASTVVATGSTVTRRISPGTPFAQTNRFELHLGRPSRYKVEWRSAAGTFDNGCGAVWCRGEADWFWMQPAKPEQLLSRDLALGSAVGVSQNVTSWLPELFFGRAPWIEVLRDLRFEPDEVIAGEPCTVVVGVFQNRRFRLWVSPQDLRLRQVESVDASEAEETPGRAAAATDGRPLFRTVQTYDQMLLNPLLSEENFQFSPPTRP